MVSAYIRLQGNAYRQLSSSIFPICVRHWLFKLKKLIHKLTELWILDVDLHILLFNVAKSVCCSQSL